MNPISYDTRSLIINGKRELLLSGAVHYPRSTPAMWPRILRECKAAGLNCIETYVFWGGHEPQEGSYDFSGRYDLGQFLDLCQQEGLHAILRIGPYICAERNFGGLPWWLISKPGMVTRTENAPFQAAMERWLFVLMAEVGDRQITHGGPIIMAQMENEYNNISARYGEAGQRYLTWAGELGRRAGVDVPVVMCYGASSDTIETLNGCSVWRDAGKLERERPNQPLIWTENWPGWYNVWGQPVRQRRMEEIAYEIIRFFAVGGTGVNYYMWYGGTNFARDAMFLQTTDYEFGCPLDSYVLPSAKGEHLAHLHHFLQQHAPVLLEGTRGPRVEIAAGDGVEDNDGVSAYPFTYGQQQLTFVTNATQEEQSITLDNQPLQLPARSALALQNGTVVYRSWATPTTVITREMVPANVTLTWEMIEEPLPGQGRDREREYQACELPHNMLLATRDTSDFGWYRTTVQRTQPGAVTLTTRVADFLAVWVNGRYLGATPTTLEENRPTADDFAVALEIPLQAGQNELLLLVTALGMIKGDWMIDAPMSEERKGLIAAVRLDGEILDGPWTFTPGTWGERVKLPDAQVATLAPWREVTAAGSPLRWYRATFTLQDELDDPAPWALAIGELFKGTLWVNGHGAGRYWQQPAPTEPFDYPYEYSQGRITLTNFGAPPQRDYQIPTDWLHAGRNTLIILEERGARPEACQLVRRR